jgi:PAS domain S-box-containing protein
MRRLAMPGKDRDANPERSADKSKREPVERLKAEQTLHEPWAQLMSIFDAIDEKVYVSDPVTHEILYANPAKKAVFGQDIIGQKCHKAFQGLEVPCDFCNNHMIFGENLGKTHIWEFQNRKNGNWLRCIDRAIRWSDGRMVRFEMAINIHDRKVAEEALRASEQEYRSIVENLNEVVYTADAAGRFSYVSPATEAITGYTAPQIVGHFFNEFILAEDLDPVRKRWAEVLSGQVKPTEFRIVKKSGETVWVRTYSKPIFQDGKAVGLRGVLLDITEYKETEAALRESERRYRVLLETMNEGFAIADENGVRTYANQRLCDMLGYKADEIIGRPVIEFLDEEGRKVWAREFKKRKKGDSSPYQMNLLTKDGEALPVIISPKPIFDEKGVFKGSYSAITNIRDLKRTEKSLIEREKELKVKTTNLEEMNAALRVLLRRMEEDRRELEDKVRLNLEQMVQPYLERLKGVGLSDRQRKNFETLQANLQEILSPFTHNLLIDHPRLTPSELQIACLLRQGKTSKEIADELSLSSRTVETHRRNMRAKLGIKDKKTNLRSYLLSNQYT